MTILALDFSSAQRSVAIAHKGSVAEAIETGGHGTHAFSLIEKVLAEAHLERSRIDTIVIGLGPGSYTGIRVALSIAQGWQLAHNVNLLGISSAECLAARAQAENIFGTVSIIVDAQRDEFYRTTYELSAVGRTEIEPLKITDLRSTVEKTNGICVGPEVTRWFPDGKILFPSAATLARIAVDRTDFKSGDQLTPIYLREASFVKAPPPNPAII